eukprot:gene5418-biopygen13149
MHTPAPAFRAVPITIPCSAMKTHPCPGDTAPTAGKSCVANIEGVRSVITSYSSITWCFPVGDRTDDGVV